LKEKEVLGGYDRNLYECKRVFAENPVDGVKVPISIILRKDLEMNGANPTVLYGYGAYGIPMEPGFNSNRLSYLERGFVYAIAHIRFFLLLFCVQT